MEGRHQESDTLAREASALQERGDQGGGPAVEGRHQEGDTLAGEALVLQEEVKPENVSTRSVTQLALTSRTACLREVRLPVKQNSQAISMKRFTRKVTSLKKDGWRK